MGMNFPNPAANPPYPQMAAVQKKYRLHTDIERMLKWMGPMEEMTPNPGWIHTIGDTYPA
jgi:hypothetical protein